MLRPVPALLAIAFAGTTLVHAKDAALPVFNYPATKKIEVVDDYDGKKVTDPYRWLEDANSPETQAWVEEQNKVTFKFLREIPVREEVRAATDQAVELRALRRSVQGGRPLFLH